MNNRLDNRMELSRGGDDRISALPNHLLCHILSLVPTRYAARTSVLSRRWKDLFASVPIIDCDELVRLLNDTQRDNFIAFIYRVLDLIELKLSRIHRFRINLSGQLPLEDIVFSWISTVVRCNVQELSITVTKTYRLSSPLSLFTCKSLVDLKLHGKFSMDVPQPVSLPSLKTLSLAFVVMGDDNSLTRLISGCPVLEDLICYNIENIKVYNVSSPPLKKFVFTSVSGDYELLMEVPSLKIFKFKGSPAGKCSGDAFNSLFEASIHVSLENFQDVSQGKKIHEIIEKASNAHKILLHGDTMEGLGYAPQLLPNFHALTYMELGASRDEGWRFLPHLLESSPFIRTLILTGFGNKNGEFPLPHVPICFSMHLKTIQLNWFRAKEEEFTMVEYILENAKVVEDIMIHTGTVGTRPHISARLLDFSTYSKTCRVMLDGLYLCEK